MPNCLDTVSGFRDVVMIDGIWSIGENIVLGKAVPNNFYLIWRDSTSA